MFYSTKGSIAKSAKALAVSLSLGTAALCLMTPAPAAAQDAGSSKPVCLDVARIDHTEVLNNHQILFYMLGRKVWINNLKGNCATLDRTDGFVWESRIEKYCDNLETIRVIRTGEVCLLGAFTPYQKPPAS